MNYIYVCIFFGDLVLVSGREAAVSIFIQPAPSFRLHQSTRAIVLTVIQAVCAASKLVHGGPGDVLGQVQTVLFLR